jgi:hypothetical protein
MGSVRHKKIIETPNQLIETKEISNKSVFSTSKVKRSQKLVWSYPTEFAGSPQNTIKIQNTKSTNQDEIFFKKSMFSALKKKGATSSYGDYPTEFAGST